MSESKRTFTIQGSDLGFEGGFSVLSSSVNEILTPHFIEKKLNEDFVLLKKTKFKTAKIGGCCK